MNGKLNKNIGFSLLPFAFIFLFEPGLTIFDPLPDCIGYMIMYLAVRNLADINYKIDVAIIGFKKGILISLLRFVSIYLLDSYFSIDSGLSIGLLLFCFIFAFFEISVLIPAFRSFFEGILFLGMMHDGQAVYLKKIKTVKKMNNGNEEYSTVFESSRNITEKAYTLTTVFITLRALAMTLPEFTSLSGNTEYEFVSLLRLLGIIIVLPIGIVWMIKMISYCARIRKDRVFIENLSSLYLKNSKERPNLYTARRLSFGIGTLMVSFVMCADFYSDYVNLLPNYIFYILVIAAMAILIKYTKKALPIIGVGVIGCAVSYISHGITIGFHSEFYPAAVKKSLEAYNEYYKMFAFTIAEAVIAFITVFLIMLALWDIFKKHTDIADTEKNSRGYNENKKRFIFGSVASLVLGFATAGSSIFYVYSQPYFQTSHWYFYYSSIISVAIHLVFIFSVCYFIGYLNNSIKYYYRNDIM